MSFKGEQNLKSEHALSDEELKESIDINGETINSGIWRPSIFKNSSDTLEAGASTKELKRIINIEEAKIRVTGEKDRFDENFSRQDSEKRRVKIGAGRILTELLKRIAPEADPHDIQKTALEHGNKTIIVDQKYLSKSKEDRAKNLADGMITNLKKIPLMVTGADCPPVGIYDPDHQSIGVFHSGWRGTLKQISPKGVQAMNETYGSDPKELLVVVAPRADGERFEVDGEVRNKFLNAKNEKGELIYNPEEVALFFKANPEKPGHYFLNMGLAIKNSLIKAGIAENHIQLSNYSTMSEEGNQLFSSERIEGQKARDSFAFIMALK